jgi:alkane 1-monooxygenase
MSLRTTPLLTLIPLALPGLVLVGHAFGSATAGISEFLIPVMLFGLFPILDRLAGDDTGSPDDPEVERLQEKRAYSWALLAWATIQILLLVWALDQMRGSIPTLGIVGLTFSIGILTGGLGITVAHELGHRRTTLERGTSSLLLLTVGYLHYQVEHNRGHHSRVGTDSDPASARREESLWQFLPRTLAGSLLSAWRFECEDLAKAGRPAWHPSNRVLISLSAWPLLAATGFFVAGMTGVVLMIGQAIVAVVLLEAVNFVEHYGLRRRRLPDGTHERFRRMHAWDSPRRLSNIMLFNLQRHSHHHQDVLRHYQGLCFEAEGPVLPSSYPVMILLALVPALFRAAIHPRLDEMIRRSEPETTS